jgi:hypothetical protein
MVGSVCCESSKCLDSQDICYDYEVTIPSSVRGLLHDLDVPPEPSGAAWERVVIERVMERGTWVDMRWLLASFGRQRLAAFLAERGCRVLAPREVRFWATICHTPEDEANRWVASAITGARAWRG